VRFSRGAVGFELLAPKSFQTPLSKGLKGSIE